METNEVVQVPPASTVTARVLKLDAQNGWLLLRTDDGLVGWTDLILHTAFAVGAAAHVQTRSVILSYRRYEPDRPVGKFWGAHIELA